MTSALDRLDELAVIFEKELADFAAWASPAPVENLHDAMAYALGIDSSDPKVRGKRIRPLLCLISAEALGAPISRAMPFALAIELMHNFCLVHDDLEDGDTMRRGRPSVWVRHGMPHAVNSGDYLLVQTQRALLRWGGEGIDGALRLRLLDLLGETLDHTHVGQALDMNARQSRTITVDDYMKIVREKTGYYLAAPIEGGALAAGAGEEVLSVLSEMAHLLGPMFQIMDDIIDLTEGKGREGPGSDIGEGKRSFMVAWSAEKLAASGATDDLAHLFDVLDAPRESTSAEDVRWVTALFERLGAMTAGRERCIELFEQSMSHLGELPSALSAVLAPIFNHLARRDK